MTSTPAGQTLKNYFLGLILPVLIVALGAAAIAAMGKSKPKTVEQLGTDPSSQMFRLPTVRVGTAQAFSSEQTLDIDVTGVVVPFRQVTVASEVAGRVQYKSEDCRIGRFVEAGQVLVRLDPTDFQLEVERLAALRESEYAQQKELEQEVSNAQRSLELAEQDVAIQEKELARLQQLPQGFSSATELDQAKRSLLSATTQRVTIQNQLDMLASRRTRIQLMERLASTQLQMARINLERTEIKAPITGVVVAEMVELASYLQKGTTLCQIDDTQQVEVSCNLRTDQLLLVLDQQNSKGEALAAANDSTVSVDVPDVSAKSYELPSLPVTVEYRVAGRDDEVYRWQGILSRYEGIGIDPKSRTVPVRIVVANPREVTRDATSTRLHPSSAPPALVQGMFIDCKIHSRPHRPLLVIPKLGLRPGNQIWQFVPDPSLIVPDTGHDKAVLPEASAVARDFHLEEWTSGRIQVIEGIRPIRTVRDSKGGKQEYWVIEQHDQLHDGDLVVVSPFANLIGDGSDVARYHHAPSTP